MEVGAEVAVDVAVTETVGAEVGVETADGAGRAALVLTSAAIRVAKSRLMVAIASARAWEVGVAVGCLAQPAPDRQAMTMHSQTHLSLYIVGSLIKSLHESEHDSTFSPQLQYVRFGLR